MPSESSLPFRLVLTGGDTVFSDICRSVFEGSSITYPSRRVTHEDNGDAKMGS